jgi:pilus assembly protein CpaB
MKQRIIPIISIVIGVLAGVLTYQYIQGERRKLKKLEERIFEKASKIKVMVATREIPSGTTIKISDVTPEEVFRIAVGNRAVELEQGKMILGRKALFPVKRGEPIMWDVLEGGRGGGGLAEQVTTKMRAVSLSISGANCVSSMVQPNDRVDVLGTFSFPSKTVEGEMEAVTLTVLQDVSVLATGQMTSRDSVSPIRRRGPTAYSTITLEVTPREAELLVFAQQLKGRLALTLRNPRDVSYEKELPSVDFKRLETTLPELNSYRQRNIRYKTDL